MIKWCMKEILLTDHFAVSLSVLRFTDTSINPITKCIDGFDNRILGIKWTDEVGEHCSQKD